MFADGINNVVEMLLAEREVDFVVASMFLGDQLRTGMRPKRGWLGAHAMVSGHSVGMLIRTRVHDKVGLYSTSYKLASDALMIKKLFYSGLTGVASDVSWADLHWGAHPIEFGARFVRGISCPA